MNHAIPILRPHLSAKNGKIMPFISRASCLEKESFCLALVRGNAIKAEGLLGIIISSFDLNGGDDHEAPSTYYFAYDSFMQLRRGRESLRRQ